MNSDQTLEGFQLMGAGAAFKSEICSMISDMPLFADFGWVDIESLSCYVQCYQVAAKTVIFKEGDVGNYMCLLIKGQVEIVKEDHEGKPHRLGLIGCGKTFGEMSLIDNERRSATCIASQHCELLVNKSKLWAYSQRATGIGCAYPGETGQTDESATARFKRENSGTSGSGRALIVKPHVLTDIC